jgi:transposase InsO family protein
VPNRIISDLGKAFTSSVFQDFCQDNLIDVYYSSVAHPRCNGQVERANGMCETWVPLGPHRLGSRLSPTSVSGLLEDLPTC